MHLIALHDAEGAIVAAVLDDGEHHGPVPVPSQGLSVSRLELSTEQAELSLDVLCRRVRIDRHRGRSSPSPMHAVVSRRTRVRVRLPN